MIMDIQPDQHTTRDTEKKEKVRGTKKYSQARQDSSYLRRIGQACDGKNVTKVPKIDEVGKRQASK